MSASIRARYAAARSNTSGGAPIATSAAPVLNSLATFRVMAVVRIMPQFCSS